MPAISTTSPAARIAHGSADRGVAIALDGGAFALTHAAEDLRDDVVAVFAARIVVGDDDAIGETLGDRAHLRTLALIALAARTEHADQLRRS